LKDVIVSGLTDFLATSNIGLLQLPAKFDEVAVAARLKISDSFAKFGLELTDFVINSITPPEEVEKAIDAKSGMSILGDLRSYTLYQAANSMAAAGENAGTGSGIGFGMGMAIPAILQQSMQASAPPVVASAVPAAAAAPSNKSSLSDPSRLNLSSLEKIEKAEHNDVRSVIRKVAGSSNWTLREQGDHWEITLPVGSLRKQTVHATFGRKDQEGHDLVCFWSPCGPASPKNAVTLLRFNNQTLHGAFAFQQSSNGSEMVVLRANLLADTTDALEVLRVVSALAWQADEVEEQLLGEDTL
jgi:hypothetical protein